MPAHSWLAETLQPIEPPAPLAASLPQLGSRHFRGTTRLSLAREQVGTSLLRPKISQLLAVLGVDLALATALVLGVHLSPGNDHVVHQQRLQKEGCDSGDIAARIGASVLYSGPERTAPLL
jgi:hypothetical protein